MKTLATLFRHGVTYLVGLLIAWFTLHLSGADLKSASDAANALIEPLVIVLGFVGVILTRLAMPYLSKIFRRGAGETDGDSGGGLLPCFIVLSMAAAFMGSLPSCSPQQIAAVRAVPLKVCATYHGVEVCASSSK